jgi:hypothetical protein
VPCWQAWPAPRSAGHHVVPKPWLTYNRPDVRMPTCVDPAPDPGTLPDRLGERTRTPSDTDAASHIACATLAGHEISQSPRTLTPPSAGQHACQHRLDCKSCYSLVALLIPQTRLRSGNAQATPPPLQKPLAIRAEPFWRPPITA